MATLTIRNISDEAYARFRIHAAEHGRSMEAEARGMIETCGSKASSTTPAERMVKAQSLLRDAFGGAIPSDLVDDYLSDRRAAAAKGE